MHQNDYLEHFQPLMNLILLWISTLQVNCLYKYMEKKLALLQKLPQKYTKIFCINLNLNFWGFVESLYFCIGPHAKFRNPSIVQYSYLCKIFHYCIFKTILTCIPLLLKLFFIFFISNFLGFFITKI